MCLAYVQTGIDYYKANASHIIFTMMYRVKILTKCVKKHLAKDAICTALAENLTILTSNDLSDCDEES